MKREVYDINIKFTFDPARRGAKYSVNGGASWINGGELKEIIAKAVHGYMAKKDACTRFDVASDIPECEASVKSAKASLTNMKLADTFEGSLREYFARTVSKSFWYVIMLDGQVVIYKMNAGEFERFLRRFAKLNERGVIRLAGDSGLLQAWLDANAD